MERPALEVAEILRRFESQYRQQAGSLSRDQARVVSALTACRTAVLGGHIEACDACGHRRIAYNSCRNRHCPKCQAAATARWLERERSYLLPVPYAHVVFTVPEQLAPILLQNPRVGYGLLFQAAADTLLEIAADPKHLGAQIGFVAILHTWGQTLHHHPHLHCLVPAGGLALGESRWVPCRRGFFLPVRVLSALFRGKYLALLQRSHGRRALRFHGKLGPLADPSTFAHLIYDARRKPWVVYAKPPFGGPEPVLKYLARYTHRIAISNARLLSLSENAVTFAWKDYRGGGCSREIRLAPVEFVRRFLLHVLPKGFVRIRRYGLLANSQRQKRLARCREILGENAQASSDAASTEDSADLQMTSGPPTGEIVCAVCKKGRMRVIDRIPPHELRWARAPPALPCA